MFENDEGQSGISLVAEDYVKRKNIPQKDKVRVRNKKGEFVEVKQKNPWALTRLQEQHLIKDCLPPCQRLWKSKIKTFINKFEEDSDIESEGTLAFYYSLGKLDRRKLPEYHYSSVPQHHRKFPLHDKKFKDPRFKQFVVSFFKKQTPVKKLKKTYGALFEDYKNGALEWMSRQFLSRFNKGILTWHKKENRRLVNDARNKRQTHTQDDFLSINETNEAELNNSRTIEYEEMVLGRFINSNNPDHGEFRDFLEDVLKEVLDPENPTTTVVMTEGRIRSLKKTYGKQYETYKEMMVELYEKLGQTPPDFELAEQEEKKDLIDRDFPR